MEDVGLKRRRLRIIAIHRYFWPDSPPYATMLRHIADRWAHQGHCVEVLSSQPSYKRGAATNRMPARQVLNGIHLRRIKLPNEVGRPHIRVANALVLASHIAWKAITRRYDVIMISTAPPIVGGLAAALSARVNNSRFIYHCMDIQPEVGTVSGEFAHPAIFRILRRIDTWTCREAEPVVVLSSDMESTLRRRPGGAAIHSRVLNNFSLPSDVAGEDDSVLLAPTTRLRVLFAGNIGRFQGLDIVIRAMAKLQERDDIEFVLMGDGAAKKSLQTLHAELGGNVRFMGHQPIAIAKKAMREADFGFISLVPEMYKYAYPSKTMTYLEQGCPLIVAVEPDSQLATEVQSEKIGFVAAQSDHEALADLLTELASWPSEAMESMRARAAEAFHRHYEESVVLNKWAQLICEERSL